MMRDHAMHELDIRLRAWRERGLRRCGQRLTWLTRRTRLHHNRLRGITLLCPHGRAEETGSAEENCGSAGGEQHAAPYGAFSYRLKCALAAKTVKLQLK